MKKFLTFLFVLALLGVIAYFAYEYFVTGHEPPVDNPDNVKPKTEFVTVKGVKFKMVKVEGGHFMKTDGSGAHQEFVSTFCIGATEVTQELWMAVMGNNPSYFTQKDGVDNLQRPVENFSWSDCRTFINKLNKLTGKKFRLPKEAEWEYSARGGNKSTNFLFSGSITPSSVAWYSANSGNKTHPVATKALNELGLCDMSGNVEEICEDSHSGHGGCYNSSQNGCMIRARSVNTCPDKRVGFRLAL